jgi:hypothetical protein
MYFSGIDQHKAFSVITTLAADGARLAQASLPNERATLLGYFAQLPGPHRAGVEATGRWSLAVTHVRADGILLQGATSPADSSGQHPLAA